MSKEEKARIDLWLGRKADFEAESEEWQDDLRRCRSPKQRAFIEQEIAHTNRVLDAIRRLVPD